MPFEYNDKQKETGVDVDLEISGIDGAIPVTSASFSEEADTSEVQFNSSYSKNIAVTGVTYSGSFEIAGRNNTLRDHLWGGDPSSEGNDISLPTYLTSITFIDGDSKSYTFENVLVTSHEKDSPADDRVTESYDFSAEKLVTTTSGQ